MGFFDKFKKNKNDIKTVDDSKKQEEQLPFSVEYSQSSDGKLQVEFYDERADFQKFYDTTRLIVDSQPLDIAGHKVYNCAVSWYGRDDCQMLNEETGKIENLRAEDSKQIMAEIDLELLQTNPYYCNMLMKGLLDKKRVERYLENGLQETPEQPCGNYIGGIRQTEKGYGKFFSLMVGQISHNSELMINKRRERKEMIERHKQQAIENKKIEIEKLQSEIDSIDK